MIAFFPSHTVNAGPYPQTALNQGVLSLPPPGLTQVLSGQGHRTHHADCQTGLRAHPALHLKDIVGDWYNFFLKFPAWLLKKGKKIHAHIPVKEFSLNQRQ